MRHVRFLSGIDNPTLPEYILKDGNTDEIIWNYSQQVGDIYDVDYIIDDLVQIVNEYYSAIESEND